VTLLDVNELDDRDTARRKLGLPLDRRLALVAMGAGNISDTTHEAGAVMAALRQSSVEICVTQTEIAASHRTQSDMHVIHEFPLSRRFRAFDLAVSASGYNSFHELLRFGIPTLFIPNQDTALDDQGARARFASDNAQARRRGWSCLRIRFKVPHGWRAGCQGIDGSVVALSRTSGVVPRRGRWRPGSSRWSRAASLGRRPM
jgi:Glycosyltransferase family 28 C-terminal domain